MDLNELRNRYKKGSEYIQIKDTFWNVYRQGQGKKVLFFPSWPMSGIEFLPLFDLLNKSDLELITFDLPNWIGYSSKGKYLDMKSLINELEVLINTIIDEENSIAITYSVGDLIVNNLKHTNFDLKLALSPVVNKNLLLESRQNIIRLFHALEYTLPDKLISHLLSLLLKRTTYKTDYYTENKEMLDFLYEQIKDPSIVLAIKQLLSLNVLTDTSAKSDFYLFAKTEPLFVEKGKQLVDPKAIHQIDTTSDHNHVFFSPSYSAEFILDKINSDD